MVPVKNIIGTYTATIPSHLPVTVVIPALNAERFLSRTIDAVGPVHEVIVVDGGSRDRTAVLAREAGARIVCAPRGRGTQIAKGVAAARTPWLLILHADTRLQPGWQTEARAHIAAGPERAACFRFVLDSSKPQARRLERMVAWRSSVLRLPYGDQGLLIHVDLLRRVGGVR
ncbi:MAG: glycosyltransferase, partial [Acetobacteraceae bacterium]